MRFIVVLIAMTFLGCGVSKRSMKAKDTNSETATEWKDLSAQLKDSAQSTYQNLVNNKVDYRTFSAKARLNYQDAYGTQPDGQAVIRMQRDSAIWISISSSLLNIEAVRIFITPDSLIVLNKLEKTVEYRPFSFLQSYTHLPLSFRDLQDLLTANPIFAGDSVAGYGKSSQQKILSVDGPSYTNTFYIAPNGEISKSNLTDLTGGTSRDILLYYSDYQLINNHSFPFYREIYVNDASKMHAVIRFTQVEFNKELSLTFNIPDNYKIK